MSRGAFERQNFFPGLKKAEADYVGHYMVWEFWGRENKIFFEGGIRKISNNYMTFPTII